MNEPQDRVLACFAGVFPNHSREELLSADRDSLAEWDSLAGIMLLTVLQQEFQIEIDPLDVDRLGSFRAVLDYITERAPRSSPGGG